MSGPWHHHWIAHQHGAKDIEYKLIHLVMFSQRKWQREQPSTFLFMLTLVWEILFDFYALIMNVVFFFFLLFKKMYKWIEEIIGLT